MVSHSTTFFIEVSVIFLHISFVFSDDRYSFICLFDVDGTLVMVKGKGCLKKKTISDEPDEPTVIEVDEDQQLDMNEYPR